MAEMYSSAYFATVTPQFVLTAPAGNSLLKAEKRTQIDLGFTAEYENVRGGMNAYHAWVKDFITLDRAGTVRQGTTVVQPFFGYTNTDLATLAGFEGYAEHDLNDWFTTFGTVSFTEGATTRVAERIIRLRARSSTPPHLGAATALERKSRCL